MSVVMGYSRGSRSVPSLGRLASHSSSYSNRPAQYRKALAIPSARNADISLPFLCGINPKKINSADEIPLAQRAVIRALGPGIGIILASTPNSLRRFETSITPGSEIVGVPASETRAKFFPPFKVPQDLYNPGVFFFLLFKKFAL